MAVGGNVGGSGPQFVQVFSRDGINAPPWTVTLSGDQNVTGIDLVLVEVGNGARLLAPVADQQVEQGATLSLRVPLTRAVAAGQPIRFSLEPGAPAGSTIDPVSGQFNWTPAVAPGRYLVTVRLTDLYQPARTETVTFAVTVTPAPPPTGPAAEPVLADVTVKRSRKPGLRGRVQSATLVFNVPVNLDLDALRLVRTKKGKPVKNLSKWIRIRTVVQDGQTRVRIRFRSPKGKLLPLGRYSLFVQNDLVRNALTGAPLAGPEGSSHTEIRFSSRSLQWR